MLHIVHSERGLESKGISYLLSMAITHAVMSTAHPRINSLIESYHALLNEGLRRWLANSETKRWWDLLLEVLAGIYFLPSHLGYSLFMLLCKQKPE